MTSQKGAPNLRPEGLAEEERRPLPTPALLSDRKASLKRNNARFKLWPASGPPLGPKGWLTVLTFDSDPRLRPGMHQTSAYSSSPTGAVGADWDQPTGDALSVRSRKRTEQVRQGTQVNRNTEDCTLHMCRTVTDRTCQEGALQPSRHVRTQTVLWALTFAP